MSGQDSTKRAYELLLRGAFNVPFTFPDWQLSDNYMSMREKLRERKYTVKDTGIPYRMINHWDMSGLMPEGIQLGGRQSESGWRTFSIVELAWLKVIAHLRTFGFSLKQIFGVKEQVIHWNKKFGYYPSFEYCLAQALFSKKDTYLQISADGSAYLVSSEEIESSKLISGSRDWLLISIKSILTELGETFPGIQSRLELSNAEIELVDEIRHGGNSEVKAGIRGDEIFEIESTKIHVNPPSGHAHEAKMEQDEVYGRVVIQFERGKRKSVHVVKKRRFDKE